MSSFDGIPILKRLIPSLRKRRHELGDPQQYRLIKREGLLFLVDYTAWADKTAVIHGLAERPQTEFLLREITDRGAGIFLDIGAHMGSYAMMIRRHTNCRRIIAFEPDPMNFAHLQANLLINRMVDSIESHKLAVSDTKGVTGFRRGEPPNDVWSKICAPDEQGDSFVQTARLDDMVAVTGETIALKIDIEGHEGRAIAGMRELLRNNSCIMQVECFEERLPAFERLMDELGYHRFHAIAPDHYFSRT
ncbi:MAG TPA: FkbM family methyltransferase [Stellaceae bacterium]|jgi:FkbM family methyltransferase|nr:FkbM family methyltransferase [Stellaceae bacterium]